MICAVCGESVHRCGLDPAHWHHVSVPAVPHFPQPVEVVSA